MKLLDSVYTAPTEAPQEPTNGHSGPDTGTQLPVPFEVSVRFERKATIYKLCDYALDREQRLRRAGDIAGADQALRCYNIAWDELDRRDAIAAEKELRRQARMQTAAVIFRETGLVRS